MHACRPPAPSPLEFETNKRDQAGGAPGRPCKCRSENAGAICSELEPFRGCLMLGPQLAPRRAFALKRASTPADPVTRHRPCAKSGAMSGARNRAPNELAHRRGEDPLFHIVRGPAAFWLSAVGVATTQNSAAPLTSSTYGEVNDDMVNVLIVDSLYALESVSNSGPVSELTTEALASSRRLSDARVSQTSGAIA